MPLQFHPAQVRQTKLRLALFGPSGSGKTCSALRMAAGIAGERGRVAVIDTEFGRAAKYGREFTFDHANLEDPKLPAYVDALHVAAERHYDVTIIDSLSHGWQELLEQVDRSAMGKFRGNKWAAWSEGTPMQKALVNAIVQHPGHLIATMRSATAWEVQADENGRKVPVRLGLKPEQRAGIEYEFDLLLELNTDHVATVIKDGTGVAALQDEAIQFPDENLGRRLKAWLEDDTLPPAELPVGRPITRSATTTTDTTDGDAPPDVDI